MEIRLLLTTYYAPMIFLIHGEDDFQSFEKLKFLKSGFIKKYGDLNISVYDEENSDVPKIYNDIMSVPFLSEKKMIVLEKLWSKWGKDDRRKVLDILIQVPETTILLFFEERSLDEKKAKTKDLAGLLKSIPPQNIFNFNKMNEREISQLINKKIKDKGYSIDYQAINTLSALIGNNSRQINQEIQKLMAYKTQEKNKKLKKGSFPNKGLDVFVAWVVEMLTTAGAAFLTIGAKLTEFCVGNSTAFVSEGNTTQNMKTRNNL